MYVPTKHTYVWLNVYRSKQTEQSLRPDGTKQEEENVFSKTTNKIQTRKQTTKKTNKKKEVKTVLSSAGPNF